MEESACKWSAPSTLLSTEMTYELSQLKSQVIPKSITLLQEILASRLFSDFETQIFSDTLF